MATDKQIAANRLNALKSTGPKTPEGRAAVRLNGVKHGLTAKTLVLPGENESDFIALLESHEAEHSPATPTEEALVLQLVMADWRLRRLYHQEAGFYACRMGETNDSRKSRGLDDHGHWGLVADRSNQTLTMFHRQEVRLERTFHRTLNELRRLRAERDAHLASLPKTAPVDAPAPQINNIDTPADPPAPSDPVSSQPETPPTGIHIVPPADDMQ